MTSMDTWIEFMNRPSCEGVSLFEEEYKQTGNIRILSNLCLALLDIGDWKRADDTCSKLRENMTHTCESDYIQHGLVKWIMGSNDKAIEIWKESLNAEYTDAAGAIDGPLILWYAGKQLDDENLIRFAIRKLRPFWKIKDHHQISEWPQTIAFAGFLLDQIPIDVFLNKWKCDIEALEQRRLCRANFWVGMKKLEESVEDAIKYFETSFSKNKVAILENEYFLAKWEYSRLTSIDWKELEFHK